MRGGQTRGGWGSGIQPRLSAGPQHPGPAQAGNSSLPTFLLAQTLESLLAPGTGCRAQQRAFPIHLRGEPMLAASLPAVIVRCLPFQQGWKDPCNGEGFP